MLWTAITVLFTCICSVAAQAQDATEPPAVRHFHVLATSEPADPVVLAEGQSILVPVGEEPPQERTVRLLRLTFEWTALVGVRQEERTGSGTVYRVETTDEGDGFEWHLMYESFMERVPQPVLLVDRERGETYFVATPSLQPLFAVPLSEARTFDDAVNVWASQGLIPPEALNVHLPSALGGEGWRKITRSTGPTRISDQPILMGGPEDFFSVAVMYGPPYWVAGVSRSDDGTWALVLAARRGDVRILLVGQGDDWQWKVLEEDVNGADQVA